MTVDDLGDSLDLIVYASRPVAPERVLAMMNRALELLVGALERDPDRQVQGLDMLPAEDRRALIKHGARFAGSYASETLAALLPGRQIVNLSEPIETPLRSMTEVELAGKIPERPVENATIYLLNQRLELTPMGVPGEVYVGGGLTQGYLDRAGLTSERFVASPFAKGERIYRTGDRARWQANGELKLLGRVDDHEDASTSRGQTDGIEAAFLAHRSVAQATAIVSADRQGEPRLIVYVVIRENESIDAITLRADLAGSLRDHAEPFDIVIVDAPGRARVETVIAGLFAEILGIEHVDVHENFFSLGGQSLLALHLIIRIRAALGIMLPIRALFEAPTAAQLALWFMAQAETGADAGLEDGIRAYAN
jgi:acyl-CoA synthetase (AMP-forming)/AMP-acid ligase II